MNSPNRDKDPQTEEEEGSHLTFPMIEQANIKTTDQETMTRKSNRITQNLNQNLLSKLTNQLTPVTAMEMEVGLSTLTGIME